MEKESFYLRICSDLDYEEMVTDIVWGDNYNIGTVIQEKGVNNMEIILDTASPVLPPRTLPLDEFIDILSYAKEKLIRIKKID